jgi:hypothetical protein
MVSLVWRDISARYGAFERMVISLEPGFDENIFITALEPMAADQLQSQIPADPMYHGFLLGRSRFPLSFRERRRFVQQSGFRVHEKEISAAAHFSHRHDTSAARGI